ncbi:hypothetical protein [Rhizobium laguerreae]|uniref:Uncharacterized protein n=1 Tax=Rhizobium laguerreae TaxID=1076926 RepID=A0A6N9ZGK5_9HYPH|nr:hypothetical protein [Rhizobium laguerreae]NEH92020.1 hypothetical protein [Rhizobium laguerreae]
MSENTADQPVNAQLQFLTNQIISLQNQIERAELDRQKKANGDIKEPQRRPWWVTAVEILALPAAIIAIVVQFTAASGNVETNEKTRAETAKIQVEEVKTRVELQSMLDELADKKAKGIDNFRVETEALLPKIDATIQKLRALDSETGARALSVILIKYIMLWVLFHFIGLIFDVIYQIWNTSMSAVSTYVFSLSFQRKDGTYNREKSERLRKYFTWAMIVLQQVPSVLRWSLELSVFIALMIPLFNEASAAIGSQTTFETVLHASKNFDIGEALSAMKATLFSAGR